MMLRKVRRCLLFDSFSKFLNFCGKLGWDSIINAATIWEREHSFVLLGWGLMLIFFLKLACSVRGVFAATTSVHWDDLDASLSFLAVLSGINKIGELVYVKELDWSIRWFHSVIRWSSTLGWSWHTQIFESSFFFLSLLGLDSLNISHIITFLDLSDLGKDGEADRIHDIFLLKMLTIVLTIMRKLLSNDNIWVLRNAIL